MKKKRKQLHKHRNAAPPPRPRAPRAAPAHSSTEQLGYTAAGAAGTALLTAFLARQGWAPKTVAGALTAVGAGLAWKGDGATIKNLGAGAMSAAGSQLALMMIDSKSPAPSGPVTKPRDGDGLPPGALEGAFERARERLAISAADMATD
jgi:hypothetical protein